MSNKMLIFHVCLMKSMLQWILKLTATEFNKNDRTANGEKMANQQKESMHQQQHKN